MSIALREGFANESLQSVLEDLLVRFVINCPSEDLSSIERVFFQLEEAQWFYVDFIRAINPSLPQLRMKNFSKQILEICPLIWKWGDPSDARARFGKYKQTIPVRGVAMFNESLSKVLLLQGTESNSWSFPRGKINKEETDEKCAVRECLEETGFDVSDKIDENEYVERTIGGKNYKIYLIKNISEETKFQPMVRNEIKDIKWIHWSKVVKDLKVNSNAYYLVPSMQKPITNWINKQKGLNSAENLKKYAESQLKSLLGIGDSQHHFQQSKKQIDAGRDILSLLHSHSTNANPLPQIFEKLLSPTDAKHAGSPASFPQQYAPQHPGQPLPSYPFQYLIPFPFYPGIPLLAPQYQQEQYNGNGKFNPQQQQPQQQQQIHQIQQLPHYSSQNSPYVQHQSLNSSPSLQDPSSYLPVPNPGNFSKPSFQIAEITKNRKLQPSDSSKKELLSILTRPADSRSSTDNSTDASSSSSILSVLNDPKPKVTQSTKLFDIYQTNYGNSNQNVDDTESSKDLLNLLQNNAKAKKYESVEEKPTSESNPLLALLNKKSEPSPPAKITLLKRTPETNSNPLLAMLQKDTREKETREQETRESIEALSPANELLSMLRKPKPTPTPPPAAPEYSDSSKDLLSVLHGSNLNTASSNSSNSELLSILHKPQSNTSSKSDLLSILHRKDDSRLTPDPTPTSSLLSLLHKN